MKIERHYSLAGLNTLGVESQADEFIEVTNLDELRSALACDLPLTILGGGSNIVLHPRVPGRVVQPNLCFTEVLERESTNVTLRVGAGVNWHELVRYTLGQGIAGLENLALIPGSVGAAPLQNIGAYGRELSAVIVGVEALDINSMESVTLSKDECHFAYRSSAFKDSPDRSLVVTGIVLILGNAAIETGYPDVHRLAKTFHSNRLTPTQVADLVIKVRRRKLPDPRHVGNVGSFFKNPLLNSDQYDQLRSKIAIQGFEEEGRTKVAAAKLIDSCGWKGYREGSIGVWPRQPLVLVNYRGGTTREILTLAARIVDSVYQRFEVELQMEPIIIGDSLPR